MIKTLLLAFILFPSINLFSRTIEVSNELTLIQLSDKTFIHTCANNNGMVFINEGEAVIVSTPDSDLETKNLIDWVINEQEAEIIGYVIDRWHPDAMEGLDIVHENGIKSYSYELTRKIAQEKGLPIPQIGFDPKQEIMVGSEKVICHFLGEAHTKDGIVVWIPSEQILFGGNQIRNYKGWVGNIADASLYNWSATTERVKQEYGSAKIVIPGHGKHGGAELIDYTIELYNFTSPASVVDNQEYLAKPDFASDELFVIKAKSDSLLNGVRELTNAIVLVQDSTKYAEIESSLIKYQPDKRRIDSETGRVKIYDKTIVGGRLRTAVSYKRLVILKEDDSVGLRIILKEIAIQ